MIAQAQPQTAAEYRTAAKVLRHILRQETESREQMKWWKRLLYGDDDEIAAIALDCDDEADRLEGTPNNVG